MSDTPAPVSRRTHDVPVFQGEDARRVDEATRAFNEELGKTTRTALREGDATPLDEAAKALDDAKEAGLPNAVIVTVQSLGRKTYRTLKAECPPRDDNKDDEQAGVDLTKFADLLLEHFDGETGERTIVAPDFRSKGELVAWLDEVSNGTFEELFDAAIGVNEGRNPDPKASATSLVERLSGATSTSPERMG